MARTKHRLNWHYIRPSADGRTYVWLGRGVDARVLAIRDGVVTDVGGDPVDPELAAWLLADIERVEREWAAALEAA